MEEWEVTTDATLEWFIVSECRLRNKGGTEKFCGYVTWNERLQEIHLRSNYHKDYEVVHYEDIASICVR